MPDRTAPDVRFRLRGLIPVRAGKWAINVNNKKIKFFKTYPCLEIAAAERDAIEQLFGVVDHINGDRHDNRWCNLRDVTVEQNASNRLTPGALVTRNGRTYELVPV